MTTDSRRPAPGFTEFVAMMALMMSLVAMSIDAMLPALSEIGRDFGVTDMSDSQLVVSALFVGLGLGQLVYGPLSDSIGRKPAIYVGVTIFLLGCLISVLATGFGAMLVGRVLQGLGAASARIVTIALVRDSHAGRAMARIMSFIMAVFIVVPVLAPSIGQAILFMGDWRLIFIFFVLLAAGATSWFALRQPETLPPERRVPLSAGNVARGFRTAAANRVTLGYTIATGLVFGPFLGYLSSAQQILQVQYGTGDAFALYFGGGALSIGLSSVINGRTVMRYGMRRLMRTALVTTIIASVLLVAIVEANGAAPSLAGLMAYFLVVFFCIGMLFGNMNAIAMEPMGRIAGVASAFIGFSSTAIGLPLGIMIGRMVNDTVTPLAAGFAICCTLSLAAGLWADKGHPPGPIVHA